MDEYLFQTLFEDTNLINKKNLQNFLALFFLI